MHKITLPSPDGTHFEVYENGDIFHCRMDVSRERCNVQYMVKYFADLNNLNGDLFGEGHFEYRLDWIEKEGDNDKVGIAQTHA